MRDKETFICLYHEFLMSIKTSFLFIDFVAQLIENEKSSVENVGARLNEFFIFTTHTKFPSLECDTNVDRINKTHLSIFYTVIGQHRGKIFKNTFFV